MRGNSHRLDHAALKYMDSTFNDTLKTVVACHLSLVIRHFASVICYLSFVIFHHLLNINYLLHVIFLSKFLSFVM